MYYVDYDGFSYLAILENAKAIAVKKQNNGDYLISATFIGDEYARDIEMLTAAQLKEIVGRNQPLPDRIMYELITQSIYEAINKRDFLRIYKHRYEEYYKKNIKGRENATD